MNDKAQFAGDDAVYAVQLRQIINRRKISEKVRREAYWSLTFFNREQKYQRRIKGLAEKDC